jgi:hypothetical protein
MDDKVNYIFQAEKNIKAMRRYDPPAICLIAI